jgi:voltage-gated potassium channel
VIAVRPPLVLVARRWVFDTIEGGTLPRAHIFNQLMIWLILANVLAVILESVPSLYAAYKTEFDWFDFISLWIFLAEYICRLWAAYELPYVRQRGAIMGRVAFAMRPSMIVDLIALSPLFLHAFMPHDDLRILRVFRLLRFLKLARFSPAMNTLAEALYTERRALLGAFYLMIGTAIFSGAIMHYIEMEAQPEKFATIPDGIWWALATLTTIGYGDSVPITPLGKVFGGVVMIFGLALFSLPIGIIATAFVNAIHRRDFVVTWGMVAKVPLFAQLDAAGIAEVTKILRSRRVEAGQKITQPSAEADGMYLIADGDVRIDLGRRSIVLHPGEYFGEIALLKKVRRNVTATALTQCSLMVIEAADFDILMHDDPALRAKIVSAADDRLQGEWADAISDLSPEEMDARDRARKLRAAEEGV